MNPPAMASLPDRWYCRVNRERLGPMSFAQLQELARIGRLQPTDWVKPDNADKWQPAQSVPGLFVTESVAAANLPAPAVSTGTLPPRPSAPPLVKTSPTNSPPPVAPSGWHFVHAQKKHGPITFAQLKHFASTGLLAATDLVLPEGTNKWVQAASLPALFGGPANSATTPAETASAAPSLLSARNLAVSPPQPPISSRTNEMVAPGQQPAPLAAPNTAPSPALALPAEQVFPSPHFTARLVRGCWAVFADTLAHAGQSVRYGFALLQRRSLLRAATRASLALGQRMIDLEMGDANLRGRIGVFDQQIIAIVKTGASTRAPMEQRQDLLIQLATKAIAEPMPPPGAEAEYDQAVEATRAAESKGISIQSCPAESSSSDRDRRRRIALGYGVLAVVACLTVVLVGFLRPGTSGPNGVPGSVSTRIKSDDWLGADFFREIQERKTVAAFFNQYPDAEEESDDSKPEIGFRVYKLPLGFRYGFLDDRLIWKMTYFPTTVERAKDDVAKATRALGQPHVTKQRRGTGTREEYVWTVEERDMGVHYVLHLEGTQCIQHLSCGSLKWIRERNRRADQLEMPDR